MTAMQPASRGRVRGIVGAALVAIVLGAVVFPLVRDRGLLPFSGGGEGTGSGAAGSDRGLVLRFDGSGTIGTALLPDLAEGYLQSRGATDVRRESTDGLVTVLGTLPGASEPTRLEVRPGGSSSAFSRLKDGSTDVGLASRRVTDAEQQDLSGVGDMNSRASEHVLALDAVTVIVNSGRDVTALSIDQLRAIYTCAITDWSQISPTAGSGPIRAMAFEEGSGTLATFEDLVLAGQPMCAEVERVRGVESFAKEVAADRSAIAFVGLPFIGPNRAVALSTAGTAPVEPTPLTVSTETYLLTRRLYLYLPTVPQTDPLARDFVENFALGEAGQRLVEQNGFVSPLFPPPAPPAPASQPCPADLPDYCAVIAGAERIPFDVRFSSGTDQVDNRAFRNLALFAQSLAAPDAQNRQVILIGFADNAGSDEDNLRLSKARADAVAGELQADGVGNATTAGFGEALPVDTNDTPEGQEQNRRVEVWLR